MTSPTVSITPEILIATEGETFAWNLSLDAPAPEGGLSLFLPITVNDDPAPGDVEFNIDGSENISEFEFVTSDDLSIGFNLMIAPGETEAVLVSEAVADDTAETDESFTTVIADGVDYFADPEQNSVTTVITELPVVSLVTEEVSAAEGETFAWDFSLNAPAPEGGLSLFLPITLNSDPAPGDIDFNIDGSSNIDEFEFVVEDDVSIGFDLTISEGATEASLVSEVVVDDLLEGEEVFTTVIADGVDYRANPAQSQVVTNLLDGIISTDLPTISLFAEPTEVEEGQQIEFNFGLSEPVPTDGLTVVLDLVEDTDPLPGDTNFFVEGSENVTDFELIINEESGLIEQALVTLAPGASEATLLNDIIADEATEGEESISFALAESDEYEIDPEINAASYTILDTSTDLPIISLFAEPTEVEEGQQIEFNFGLSEPVPTDGLTVALDLVEDTDPLPGDTNFFVEGSENVTDFELIINEESGLIEQALVTLAPGASEATLLNDIIADEATEGEESISFALAESDEYEIDPEINAASYTILDTSTDLNTSTSTSISFELEDLLIPARDAVVDVTFDLDYISGIDDSEFLPVGAIADSIEDYLANEPSDGDFFEVITEDLGEFLVSDSGLGIDTVAELITVELDIEPNSVIPFPFAVASTIEVAEI